ncbi:MAG: hypothetical protein IKO47_08230 [Ruminococcus sp.]|nr:hypothetical protein [Ruminococcus sp.]
MKLTYRDKVILGIFLAVAIVVAGYFALIKNKNETIKKDNDRLSVLEDTEKDYKQKIAQIEPLRDTINETVDETNKITDKFVPRDKVSNPVVLDQYMQHFCKDNNIRIMTLAVSDMSESNLGYYYIEGTDIGSGLRSIADINGDYQKDVDKANAEANSLREREVPPTLLTQYGISAQGKKEDLWKLMSAIEKYDKALLINSVSFALLEDDEKKPSSSSSSGEGEEGSKPSKSSDDEEKKTIEPEDEVELNMVVSLYSVYDLPKVDLDKIN